MAYNEFLSQVQSGFGALYYYTHSYNLAATQDNFTWAMKLKDRIHYSFYVALPGGLNRKYSIIEYAILLNYGGALQELLQEKRDDEIQELLHFYLANLKENAAPNLETMTFLLKRGLINTAAAGYNWHRPLEYALEHMALYQQIHWPVIQTLLCRGAQCDENPHTKKTPFQVFCDSYRSRQNDHQNPLQQQDEIHFIYNLTSYREQEKAFFPDSTSGLTANEFRELTPYALAEIKNLVGKVCGYSEFKLDSLDDPKEAFNNFVALNHPTNDNSALRVSICLGLIKEFKNTALLYSIEGAGKAILKYYGQFQGLVNTGTFANCFNDVDINTLATIMRIYPDIDSPTLLIAST